MTFKNNWAMLNITYIFYICLLYMWVLGGFHEFHGTAFESLCSTSTWVQGIKLRLSGFVGGTFTC